MEKIMPTILAAVLMISTMSILVGCGGIEEDPDAVKTNTEGNGEGAKEEPEGTGIEGIDGNPANAGFNEDGTEKKK